MTGSQSRVLADGRGRPEKRSGQPWGEWCGWCIP